MKKKIIGGVLASTVIFVILGVIWFNAFFNSTVKKGIETFGPKVTQTSVKLDGVTISPFSGYGEINGLVIGNPEGFHTPSAFSLGKVVIDIDVTSLLSDKIIIREILIDGPEVTYEMALSGSNIDRLKKNVEALAGGDTPKEDDKEEEQQSEEKSDGGGKKIQIDSFLFQNANVNLSAKILQGQAISIPLPKIHLTDIGKDSEGSSITEIMDEVFGSIFKGIKDAVAQSGKLGDAIGDSAKQIGKTAKDGANKVFGGVKSLFKKK